MGYFDAIASGSFKETKSGQMAFYPWGRFSKGYETQTEEQYQALKRFIARYYMAMLPLGIAVGIFFQWTGLAILFLISVVVYFVVIRRMTSGLPRTEEKLTMQDSFANQARRHSPFKLWSMLIGSLLLVLGSILVIKRGDLLTGIGGVALFSACAVVFARMLVVRRRLLRQGDPDKARVFN